MYISRFLQFLKASMQFGMSTPSRFISSIAFFVTHSLVSWVLIYHLFDNDFFSPPYISLPFFGNPRYWQLAPSTFIFILLTLIWLGVIFIYSRSEMSAQHTHGSTLEGRIRENLKRLAATDKFIWENMTPEDRLRVATRITAVEIKEMTEARKEQLEKMIRAHDSKTKK